MRMMRKFALAWLWLVFLIGNAPFLRASGTPLHQSATATPTPAASTQGKSRGYLTTPEELAVIARKAAQGKEPYESAVADVLKYAKARWDYKLDEVATCPDADSPVWIDNDEGAPRLYARALAYHLTGEEKYAEEAVRILERIMTEVKTITLKEQQCRLNFSWGTPELVATADLLEAYWQDAICTGPANMRYGSDQMTKGPCKQLFQNWLVKNPYYVISYTAERAQSNWGAAATNTMAYIADYLSDRPRVYMVGRTKTREFALTPALAFKRARQLALDRMNGLRVELDSSSSCDYLSGKQQDKDFPPVKSQITERGIIPEDARRDESCNIQVYDGSYQNYPQLHLGHNIQQCELLLRRGDPSCYDNVAQDEVEFSFIDPKGERRTTTLRPGRGSIERAIKAIIIDSETQWRKDSSLEVAYRYYYNHHTLPGFELWFAELDDRPSNCSQDICFGTLTHGFAADETPTAPPTTRPPQ